mgnify:CR=1 FL=1
MAGVGDWADAGQMIKAQHAPSKHRACIRRNPCRQHPVIEPSIQVAQLPQAGIRLVIERRRQV